MKRTLAAILLALILTSFAACDTTPADTSRDSYVSSDIAVSEAESVASEEPSEAVSEEPSVPAVIYDETTAQPEVIGCTRVENNIFVIIGTCESGATVTVTQKEKTITKKESKKRALFGGNAAPALFDELKALRTHLALQKGVPPYVIFPDTALAEMSRRMPVTDSEFLDISGVGETKLKRYGKDFMDVIKAYRK